MKGGEAAVKYDMEGIYREHFHVVYLYTLGLSGNSGVTEDVVQETFLKAWKHIDSFRGECDIKTWLCRIARNNTIPIAKRTGSRAASGKQTVFPMPTTAYGSRKCRRTGKPPTESMRYCTVCRNRIRRSFR